MREMNRESVEKIFEQELSSLLLRSLKLAEAEGKPEVKEALQIILKAIDSRRDERERAKETESRG